jgi:hypothetical protein
VYKGHEPDLAETLPRPAPASHRPDLQPALVFGVLALLPPGVRVLELEAHCDGPLKAALTRFKRLQDVGTNSRPAGAWAEGVLLCSNWKNCGWICGEIRGGSF